MIRVSIIGSGNVAQHLALAFQQVTNVVLVQVLARNQNDFTNILDPSLVTTRYIELKESDVYIIAVSDNAIAEVSELLPFQNRLVVHTSGSISMDNLNNRNRKGVFYPLQTFSKTKSIDFKTIPICIEATNEEDFKTLDKLAQLISNIVRQVNSEQRRALHVSAVFVSNFVNHLYQIGSEICQVNHIDFALLQPLILETAQKILTLAPKEAQTGPAVRQDTETINAHLNFLSEDYQKEIYTILTKSIINHGQKL
jgi:predicted short-subunit dehydrogenase-like oxidoreductase (DUF2520 family)